MDKINSNGLATYFDINKGNARDLMQNDLRNKFQFYNMWYICSCKRVTYW